MNARYDVIVIGLGGMGSAIAAHAAMRNLRVLGLEQFSEGHELGASSGRSRIIRKAYFEDAAYVPLLIRAYELWRELEHRTSFEIMTLTGMLLTGAAESPVLQGAAASARRHDLALEEVSHSLVRERFPAFRIRSEETVLFERDAGFVRPEAAIAAHLAIARRHGAEVHFKARAASWASGPYGVRVIAENGATFEAERLALSLGPWFDAHAAELGIGVRIQRNVQTWFGSGDRRLAVGALPVFFADRADYPRPLYGFPDFGEGVKAAFHGFGATTTADDVVREVEPTELEALRAALDELLPGASGTIVSSKVCMYSLTPDEHFVIGTKPGDERIIVAGGFSGHGFKFCSVVGEIAADLVQRGESRHDIRFLAASRFAKGHPVA